VTVAVVHLVAREEQSLGAFLDSYARHETGLAHELVLIANGWTGVFSSGVRERVSASGSRVVEVREALYDLDAYRATAQRLTATYFVFVSSYTVIQADGWLKTLIDALTVPNVGAAATSGSYESHASSYLTAPASTPPRPLSVSRVARGLVNLGRLRLQYDRFPNPHIRTSAFAIARDVLLDIPMPPLRTKADVERLESGKRGLTRELGRRGLAAVVVGRDGVAYPAARFRESHTFRIGEQCNLLIGDNRTRDYASASPDRRRVLRTITWGSEEDILCAQCGEQR
jgi:hypothetical protein